MDFAVDHLLPGASGNSGRVQVITVPEKKGFLKKHTEYEVKSSDTRSQQDFLVRRRYSDFLGLSEELRNRYPYRLMPKLPPQRLAALVSANDSQFTEIRRSALNRWLLFLVSHPVFRDDPMLQMFLRHPGDAVGDRIRDEFRCLPDEFVTEMEAVERAKSAGILTDLYKQMEKNRQVMEQMVQQVSRIVCVAQRVADRAHHTAEDMAELGRDLASLPAMPTTTSPETGRRMTTGASGGWSGLLKVSSLMFSKLNELSETYSSTAEQHNGKFVFIAIMVQDVLNGYLDLCGQVLLDKNIQTDHKRNADRMLLLKKKQRLNGTYLAQNTEQLAELENHVEKNHFELSDLQTRKAFAMLTLHSETRIAQDVVQLLAVGLDDLFQVERSTSQSLTKSFQHLETLISSVSAPISSRQKRD